MFKELDNSYRLDVLIERSTSNKIHTWLTVKSKRQTSGYIITETPTREVDGEHRTDVKIYLKLELQQRRPKDVYGYRNGY